MEKFLARKYLVNQQKSLTVFYRFSKRCRSFCQNSTEHNDKNYSKNYYRFTAVLGIQNFILSPTVKLHKKNDMVQVGLVRLSMPPLIMAM